MLLILNFFIDTIAAMCDPFVIIGTLIIGVINGNIKNILICGAIYGLVLAVWVHIMSMDLHQFYGLYNYFIEITTCILLSSGIYGVKKLIKRRHN